MVRRSNGSVVVRQIVVHHIKRMDFFLLDAGWRADSSIRENARREGELCLAGFQNKNLALRKTALESTLPPHNDGAGHRVSERIQSSFLAQSEFLWADLLACPSLVQDACGPRDNRTGRKTSAV